VDDAADGAARLTPDRNHVAPIAHSDGHVRHLLVRLELSHDTLEQPHQFGFGAAQLATKSSELRRRVVADAAVVGEYSLEGSLVLLG
jgi:hypothetical protein